MNEAQQRNMVSVLNDLSKNINQLYCYVDVPGENYGEPAINSGPCAPFAQIFYECWNAMFTNKVHIVFIMVKDSAECWHVLIRLPNGQLFDGGHGVHGEQQYADKFNIVDMEQFDLNLLEERAYGLDRKYPRYCPTFSKDEVQAIIQKYLAKIYKDNTLI